MRATGNGLSSGASTSVSEYMVSPRWMLKSLRSARMRRKIPPVFQNGRRSPIAGRKSVSPVQANSIVALALDRGAVRNTPHVAAAPARGR